MDSRLTRTLTSGANALALLCGLAFLGKGATRMFDDGEVCAQTGFWVNASLADSPSLSEGVTASSSATRLCQDSPSVAQRAADLGGELPWLLFGALALLLFALMLRSVVRHGPFTEEVAQRLSVLGWFVAVGTPLASLVVGWSQSWLASSMAPILDSGPTFSGPLVLVLAGLTAVIMGKVMREGVRMREDLEGTV